MKAIILLTTLFVGFSAQAQEWGATAGFNNAKADLPEGSTAGNEAVLNWRAGIVAKTDIADNVYLRSGVLYSQRKMKFEEALQPDTDFKFAYLDIPVLFQFQLNEMVGLYVGPQVAINVSKKAESGGGSGDVDNTKSLYMMAQLGISLNFDGVGLDIYYERGFGDMVDDAVKDFQAYGVNGVYWF